MPHHYSGGPVENSPIPIQQLRDLELRIHAASVDGNIALASKLTMLYAETVLDLTPSTGGLETTPSNSTIK